MKVTKATTSYVKKTYVLKDKSSNGHVISFIKSENGHYLKFIKVSYSNFKRADLKLYYTIT